MHVGYEIGSVVIAAGALFAGLRYVIQAEFAGMRDKLDSLYADKEETERRLGVLEGRPRPHLRGIR
jgi:hypothetical protein